MRSDVMKFLLLLVLGGAVACNKPEDKKTPAPADKPGGKDAPAPAAKGDDGGLPPAVAAGVRKAYPQAKISKVRKESTGYEIALREDGKPDWYADFGNNGELEAVGTPVKLSDVPENIRKAFKDKYPTGKIDDEAFVERSPDGKTVKKYKLIVRSGGKKLSAEINGDGTGEIDEEPAD